MKPIELADAKKHLDELVEQVSRGEDVVIVKDNRPLARLVPIREKRERRFGSAMGQIKIAEDFDEPMEEFRDYM